MCMKKALLLSAVSFVLGSAVFAQEGAKTEKTEQKTEKKCCKKGGHCKKSCKGEEAKTPAAEPAK